MAYWLKWTQVYWFITEWVNWIKYWMICWGCSLFTKWGQKYNIDIGWRFVCHPHSDFAGFCDPTSRLPGYLPPLPYEFMCIHVWVCANLNTPTFLTVWSMFHMCEEPINIILFCESAHRKFSVINVIKSVINVIERLSKVVSFECSVLVYGGKHE